MTLLFAQSLWGPDLGERILVYVPSIVVLIAVNRVMWFVAREQYRKDRHKWAPARLALIAFGVGVELLLLAMVIVCVYGLLGYEPFFLLVVAIACFAIGIALVVIFIVLAIVDAFHRWGRASKH